MSDADQKKPSFFSRLKQGLSRTAQTLTQGITQTFARRTLDQAALDELEELLIRADMGANVAADVVAELKAKRFNADMSDEDVKHALVTPIVEVLRRVQKPLHIDRAKRPFVMLVAGVNGSGKTTTIGKLAARYKAQGLKVWLAAGDTFRAAAIEQLKIWAVRADAPIIAKSPGADAAGLAFEALEQAQAAGADILMIDTAGRLQNKAGLMAELDKIIRVLKKIDATAPHATVLVLDATTGQNAITQVEVFREVAKITGAVMTKLDGTAKGGILVSLAEKFDLPIHYIGVGEGVEDVQPFDAESFARALVGLDQSDLRHRGGKANV